MTPVTVIKYLCFIIVYVICQTNCQQFTIKPRNTGVLKNELATLDCRASNADTKEAFTWTEFINAPTGKTISVDEVIKHPSGAAKYGIVNEYDLQIKNSALTDAGKYQCKLTRATKEAFAYVVVLDTRPVCTTDKAQVEGGKVTLTCQVGFQGGWGPKLQWTGPSGSSIATKDVSSGSTSKFTATVTADASLGGASYACALSFPAPPQSLILNADYDTRNPVYTSGCSVPLTFDYGPRELQLNGTKVQYEPGDKITCSARGNPTPNYKWVKISGNGNGFPQNGAVLTITGDMRGDSDIECVASNTVRGSVKTATSAAISITVSGNPPASIHSGVTAGAVIGGLVGLGIILAVVGILLYRNRKKKQLLDSAPKDKEEAGYENPEAMEERNKDTQVQESTTDRATGHHEDSETSKPKRAPLKTQKY